MWASGYGEAGTKGRGQLSTKQEEHWVCEDVKKEWLLLKEPKSEKA